MIQHLFFDTETSRVCQVFSSTAPEKPKSWTELARFFGFFNIEGGALEDSKFFFKKSLTIPK